MSRPWGRLRLATSVCLFLRAASTANPCFKQGNKAAAEQGEPHSSQTNLTRQAT
uniref:Uncharacterized protein n=1 Tax=Setaria viridis TaxID=4556 RepID=A0A4U6WCY6_SETVI|nr:hypothetical protein SEVIR_2G390501v2 [Setaria viridis]